LEKLLKCEGISTLSHYHIIVNYLKRIKLSLTMPNIQSDENDLEQLLQSMSYLSGEEVKQLLGNKVFHAALDTSTKKIPRGGYLLITTKDSNAQLNEYPHSLELRLDLELTLKVDPE